MSKRGAPPNSSSSLAKRQRIAQSANSPTSTSNSAVATPQTDTPSAASISAAPSPADHDSLSSLSESRGSSPEVELVNAVKGMASDRVTEAAQEGHHVVSAKSVPSSQPPRPPTTGTKSNGNGSGAASGRPTQGGKGKRGEEALEHAVAAREEVERRRAKLKEANGVGVAGAREMDEAPLKVKMEEEENVEVEVIRGEDAEEIAAVAPRKERPAIAEERAGIIRFAVVTNDASPASMIILTGLKNIFQKQLPKMPREYIARLVFDRAHYSMAIVKRGLEVVGGITYRPFEGQEFAE
ncbi:hypothetical protein JCM5353_005558, partial [Sporobolomyces roseus]